MIKRQLILASQSPRRRQLLLEAGYEFRVVAPSDGAECGACSGESPAQLVARLATLKARDVAERLDEQPGERVILGCDTLAECDGQILGKPADEEHARDMLRRLRGRAHRVISGVCLVWQPENVARVDVAVTSLEMEELSDDEIEDYLKTGLWEGKAGAFGLQDRTGWVRVTSGSESNVVGLPLELLERMLDEGANGTK